jgi:protein NrfD
MASKNAFMMTIFMGLNFIYATFFFKFIPWYGWDYIRAVVAILGIIAALIAIMVPAFELGEARGRGFWNTGALIPVFFITSAVTGLGTVLLVATFMGFAGDTSIITLDSILLGFIVLQLLTVWGYVKGMEHSGAEEARRAAHNVLQGEFKNSFWGGVIIIGTIIPLIMYLFGGSPVIIMIKAILLLVGGACFRNIFLQAAVRKIIPGEEHVWGSREETAKLAADLEKRWQEKAVILFNK